jgi:hypothetical protein
VRKWGGRYADLRVPPKEADDPRNLIWIIPAEGKEVDAAFTLMCVT